MPNYCVEFAIDVSADSPKEAAQEAWATLNDPMYGYPVATVISENGDQEDIDLQKTGVYEDEEDDSPDDDYSPHDLQCTTCGVTLNDQCLEDGCTQTDEHPGTSSYCGECIVDQDLAAEHA